MRRTRTGRATSTGTEILFRADLAHELPDGLGRRLKATVVDANQLRHGFQRVRIEPSGPEMGRVLNALLDRVIEDPSLNEKNTLLELSRDV